MSKQKKIAQTQINKNKKSNWFVRILMSFLTGLATIFIYGIVIRFILAFMVSMTQSTIEDKGMSSDPVMILAFSVGISCALIALFIANVPVYSGIKKVSTKIVSFVQDKLNKKNDKKIQKSQEKQKKKVQNHKQSIKKNNKIDKGKKVTQIGRK